MHNLLKELESKVISITGGGGYIGSSLVSELKKCKVKKIIRIGRNKLKPIENIEDWILDLNDYKSWIKIVRQSDIIFHLSGNTSIIFAERDPRKTLISEVLPITNLVEAAKELNRNPRVIYTSTATVYGLAEDFPISEDQIPAPITCYDSNKLSAEQQLRIAGNKNLIEPVSLRLANVYGPSFSESSAVDRGVLSRIVRLSFENKTIKIFGSGDYIRDYVYIDDVIRALLYASIFNYKDIKKNSETVFNVASGKGIPIKEVFFLIAKKVEKITGFNLKIENVSWPEGISQIEKRNFIGSSERLKSLTGWTAKTSIEEGVAKLVNYYSKEYM